MRHSLRCVEPQLLKLVLQLAWHPASSPQVLLHELSFGVQSFFISDVSTSWQCVDGLHVGPVSTGASLAASPLEDDELVELPEPPSTAPLDEDDAVLVSGPASGAVVTGSGSEPTHAAIAASASVNEIRAFRTMAASYQASTL